MKLKYRQLTTFGLLLLALLLLNYVAQYAFFRIDLTSDKRYKLSKESREVASNIDETLIIRVYLDGEMPISLKKLRTTIRETLDELKVYAGSNLQYEFVNVSEEANAQDIENIYVALRDRGLSPVIVTENTSDGASSERILFPGALLTYTLAIPSADTFRMQTREIPINFLQGNASAESERDMVEAQQNVEFELVNALHRAIQRNIPAIAFIEGHGELDEYETGDIVRELASFARIDRVLLDGHIGILDDYAAVIVARPTMEWSDADKIVLDQYIMGGGRTAWFIDAVAVHHDSLSRGEYTFALVNPHRLDDQLFKYGVRINPNVVQDLHCAYLPVNIAEAGKTADFRPAPWTYYPLLVPPTTHVITRNMNYVESKYPSVLDTVGKNAQVMKSILLHTSEYSRATAVPLRIGLNEAVKQPEAETFNRSYMPIAALLEGVFPSAFLNRPLDRYNNGQAFNFVQESMPTKMIVVADGDIIRNEVSRRADRTGIYPLGFDVYMNTQFGNRQFVLNAISYLLDDDNIMQVRRREWTVRLLDKNEIRSHRTFWVTLNTVLPIVCLFLIGGVFIIWRKRKYAKLS